MTWEPFQEPSGPQGPFIEYGTRYGPSGPAANPNWLPPDARQTGWGAQGPGVSPPPRTLWEAIKQLPGQYVRVLTKPASATFDYEMRKARWDVVWAQILGYALVAAILLALSWLVIMALIIPSINTAEAQAGGSSLASIFGVFFVPAPIIGAATFFVVIGSFFLGQGITFLLAKAFGGQGSFLAQIYTFLLYQVPIGLITAALSLIPIVGSIAGLAGIYAYVLQYFQMVAVHRLTTGKALAVVLIPVGVGFLLGFALVALYFVFIFSVVGSLHPTQ